jgi:hypothetical protein
VTCISTRVWNSAFLSVASSNVYKCTTLIAFSGNSFQVTKFLVITGSLLQLLGALEKEPLNESQNEPQNAFFWRLMHGGSHCLGALWALENFTSVKPLLRKLLFQMDNCVKNNKNCHFLAFLQKLNVWRSVISVFSCWSHPWGQSIAVLDIFPKSWGSKIIMYWPT